MSPNKIFDCLNANPILYKSKDFYIVYFGLYSAIASFMMASLVLTYLASKGVTFGYTIIIWFNIGALISGLVSKLLHPIVIGKDFFCNPKKYLRQTAFYNQSAQYGSLIAVIVISYAENVNFLLLLDAVCYGGCLALAIGRMGCYNYGCCYGRPTTSCISVRYTNFDSKILRIFPEFYNVNLIPTQLINVLFDFSLFVILTIIYFNNAKNGIIFLIFGICYNLFRVFTQRLRGIEIKENGKREHKLFIYFSGSLIGVALISALLAIYYYPLLPITPTIIPLSISFYLKNTFFNFINLSTELVAASIYFVMHGFHKKLGQHF